MRMVGETENNKYLGIPEANTIEPSEMKGK